MAGLTVGVLGLAFKPGTDDVRDAPAIDLIRSLAAEGVSVRAFDPRAMEGARPKLPTSVQLVGSVLEASDRAQALVLLTEWDDIINSDWRAVAGRMARPRVSYSMAETRSTPAKWTAWALTTGQSGEDATTVRSR